MWKKLTIFALLATSFASADNYFDALDTLTEAKASIPMVREVRVREIADQKLENAIWMLRQDRFDGADLICAHIYAEIGNSITDSNDQVAMELLNKIKQAETLFKGAK